MSTAQFMIFRLTVLLAFLSTFGASGPYVKVYEKYGLTGDNIAKKGQEVIDFYAKRGGDIFSPLNTCFTHVL
jgi:transketolase